VGWKVRSFIDLFGILTWKKFFFLGDRIRLYSTKSLKPLGTLEYHKSGCHAVAFARSSPAEIPRGVVDDLDDEDEETDEMDGEEKEERSRWLAGGAKDGRVSIWPLISFHKK
jgi:hypothetical protein